MLRRKRGSGWACTSYAASNDVSVMVNGEYVDFSGGYGQPFITDENRILLPIRFTMEAMGAKVSWDNINNIVLIENPEYTDPIKILKNSLKKYGEYDSDMGYVYSDLVDYSSGLVSMLIYDPYKDKVSVYMDIPDSNGGYASLNLHIDEPNYNLE